MFRRVCAVSMVLFLCMIPVVSAAEMHESSYIHISSMLMTFDGADANITVKYKVDNFFAKLYMLLIGPDAIEQKMEEVFAEGSKVTVTDISWGEVKVTASDMISYDGDIYYIQPFRWGQNVDELYIIFPDGYLARLEDVNTTRTIVHRTNTQFFMMLPT